MSLDPAMVFQLCNGLALLTWTALIVSPPSAPWTARVWWLSGRAVPALLSAIYLVLMVTQWRGEGGFGSIEQVRALFDVPGLLVAGWVHYLAFDLFVGTWIASRSQQTGLKHRWVIPILLLTFMLGPVGLLTFLALTRRPRMSFPGTHPGVSP